jgi:long-chain acyl-CoA synthetase
MKNLTSYLYRFTEKGNDIAYVHRDGLRLVKWSYKEIARASFQFARLLEQRGIRRSDKVLIHYENSAEWVVAFWGTLLRGAVVVPLDLQSTEEFVERVSEQVKARLILCHSSSPVKLEVEKLLLDGLKEQLRGISEEDYKGPDLLEDDIAQIIFTSGTTESPKGVILTHKNILANLRPLESEIRKYLKWEKLVHPLRFLSLVPLSHVFGQFMGLFVPQLISGTVFFTNSVSPAEIINSCRQNRISVLVAVPRFLLSIREKLERDWLSEKRASDLHKLLEESGRSFLWRLWTFREVHRKLGWKFWAFISGGATLEQSTEEFWNRLGFVVIQGYGMTETASLVSLNHPFKRGRGSIGKSLPGREIRIDETGEVLVRGENVSPGYWNSPHTRDEEDWLRTGDIAEVDASGNLYFKGRKKDVIVTSAGLNIYPEDLEAVFNRQPEVSESVVISFESGAGPEPLVVLKPSDPSMDPASVLERANKELAPHQRVGRIVVWPLPDFPRTSTQKVKKSEVKEIAIGLLSGDTKLTRRNLVSSTIAQVAGTPHVELDPSLNLTTDLKLDSIGRVELISALEEKYQIELDESSCTTATTVGDLLNSASDSTRNYPDSSWAQSAFVKASRTILFYTLVLPVTRLMCWVRVEGVENIEKIPGPVLFISNHITMADQALILSALPGRFRRNMAIAMEGEILREWYRPANCSSVFGRLLGLAQYYLVVTIFNVFPLPKKSGFRKSFRFAGESMDRGFSLLVFPEGTRSNTGRMNRFMSGIGYLASQLHTPIVPLKIKGLYELKERRQYFSWPGEVTVSIGRPLSFKDRTPLEITDELEQKVACL